MADAIMNSVRIMQHTVSLVMWLNNRRIKNYDIFLENLCHGIPIGDYKIIL